MNYWIVSLKTLASVSRGLAGSSTVWCFARPSGGLLAWLPEPYCLRADATGRFGFSETSSSIVKILSGLADCPVLAPRSYGCGTPSGSLERGASSCKRAGPRAGRVGNAATRSESCSVVESSGNLNRGTSLRPNAERESRGSPCSASPSYLACCGGSWRPAGDLVLAPSTDALSKSLTLFKHS